MEFEEVQVNMDVRCGCDPVTNFLYQLVFASQANRDAAVGFTVHRNHGKVHNAVKSNTKGFQQSLCPALRSIIFLTAPDRI
jgi:hypothetical protein